MAQTCHAQGVYQLTVTHRILAEQALGLEAELAIQPDRRVVVRIHRQFHPLHVHPVVREVQRRGQQASTQAFALPRHRNPHADVGAMTAPNARELLQADVADHLPLMQRHQLHHPLVPGRQAFAPDLGGLVRRLQHLASNRGVVVQRSNAFDVGFAETLEGNDGIAGRHRGFFLERGAARYPLPAVIQWSRAA
ncbi:hypothetical protein D3C84_552480 [compost metagenome]